MKNKILVLALILMPVLLTACGEKIKPGTARVKRPVIEGVGVAVVDPSRMAEEYESAATVVSKDSAMVSAKIMGTITSVRVLEGQKVKKGDVLLTIASPETDEKAVQASQGVQEATKALNMAQEQKALAESTFNRMKSLYEQKAISRQEFDEAATRTKTAQLGAAQADAALGRMRAARKEAEIYRGYSVLRAPISGVVVDKKADPGSMAMPGMPLLLIEAPQYQVETSLDESLWGKVKPGMALRIEAPSAGFSGTAKVAEVVPSIDRMTRSFTVKLESPSTLTSGQFVKVYVPLGEKQALLVPANAVVERGELRFVYVVGPDGVVELRAVRGGKRQDNMLEVVSGLSAGERIITSGLERAVEGAVVKGYGSER
jgi:multidrug efflux system membrane fusion protein